MGELIRRFTFGRNALKRTAQESAEAAMAAIRRAQDGIDMAGLKRTDNGAYNVITDLISFSGVLVREGDECRVTSVGEAYGRLYDQNSEDAWRWLITRALWLYTVPNGTRSEVNAAATSVGASFSFFPSVVGLLLHLSALPNADRYLYYEEFCAIYDDDHVWGLPPADVFALVLARRQSVGPPTGRGLLTDLEPAYSIPRDNMNGVLNKAFQQTGLFDYLRDGARTVGIAIGARLDGVLQNRIRFVLDHPVSWGGDDWTGFLQLRPDDLPEEVSLLPGEVRDEDDPTPDEPIDSLVAEAAAAFASAGLRLNEELVRRLAASLLTNRFVILTGLSGSGKTKLAQAFASWISPHRAAKPDPFSRGTVIESDRTQYTVLNSDALSVEVESPDHVRIVLPRALIDEWAECILTSGFGAATPPRTIRDKVAENSAYSRQLSSFESQLKAAAFAKLTNSAASTSVRHYDLVPVGADWTTKESCIGYADALDPQRYVRTTPIVDLLLRAHSDPEFPYFLILDEMNLSHVERYFSDFLSAIESGEEMVLHGSPKEVDGVPAKLPLPHNLFIIGTVNVDETTYMFSPKVLDRANSLEFRVEPTEIGAFLSAPAGLDLRKAAGGGRHFARAFAIEAAKQDAVPNELARISSEVALFFRVLAEFGAEFAFRTAKEIVRFAYYHRRLSPGTWEPSAAFDAQISQKILPKLNGSRRRLEPILCALAILCHRGRAWDPSTGALTNGEQIFAEALDAASAAHEQLHVLHNPAAFSGPPAYPLSFAKVVRMLTRVTAEGFTSFAEA